MRRPSSPQEVHSAAAADRPTRRTDLAGAPGAPRCRWPVCCFTGWVMWRSTLGLQWARVPLAWLILRATVYAVERLSGRRRDHDRALPCGVRNGRREDVIRATFRALVRRRVVRALRHPADPAFTRRSYSRADSGGQRHAPLYMQWRVQQPPPENFRATRLFANVQLPERRFFRDSGPDSPSPSPLQTGVCAPAAASSCAWPASRSPPALPSPRSSRWPRAAVQPQAAARACRARSWDSRSPFCSPSA